MKPLRAVYAITYEMPGGYGYPSRLVGKMFLLEGHHTPIECFVTRREAMEFRRSQKMEKEWKIVKLVPEKKP